MPVILLFPIPMNQPQTGQRRNMGAYGNTIEASRGRTNNWLLARTYNDGGMARDAAVLSWLSSQPIASGNDVNLYSIINDVTNLITTIAIDYGGGLYSWDVSVYTNLSDVRWRVELASDPTIFDETDHFFALDPTMFYVNDAVTNNDIYTTAIGDIRNDGVNSNRPLNALSILLDIYDIDPAKYHLCR